MGAARLTPWVKAKDSMGKYTVEKALIEGMLHACWHRGAEIAGAAIRVKSGTLFEAL